jgi:hypothetical protein
MNSQDALLSHVISQTISSLTFLQSQNIISSSPELDQVRNQLISRQHGGLAANMSSLSLVPTAAATPSPQMNHAGPSMQSSSASTHTGPPMPGLPPRRNGPASVHEPPKDRAVALWDYNSTSYGDLSFRKDDVVIVDEEGEVEPSLLNGTAH